MAAAEKRRAAPAAGGEAGRAAPSTNGVPENEAEFLLQAGVNDMVREAILKVLEARPEQPVDFLAGYFEKLMQGSPEAAAPTAAEDNGDPQRQHQLRLDQALWYLRLAHQSHSRMAFNNNVSLAYESLSIGGRRKKPGVNGKLYSEVLRMMCQDRGASEETVLPFLRKIMCRDHEAVPFEVFRYGALTCLVLLEFLTKADALYDTLDDGSGAADKRVCMAVLSTLEEALRASDVSVPIRYLEAGSKLGPDCLALAMDKALTERKVSMAMKKDEFLKRASAIFAAKVKSIG
ncbi:tubulin polyglutamylase complex subunit 1 [Hemicordylus capensis]|uniref:tubulin polyglutamylase complex subunit 1 n=1 Tax=Hemicordylus capensis TaxID=884348 RepID=UPI0023047D7D|nr:tubulin polyglutamylase complex subunit 1 [Hemicordylus capensis]